MVFKDKIIQALKNIIKKQTQMNLNSRFIFIKILRSVSELSNLSTIEELKAVKFVKEKTLAKIVEEAQKIGFNDIGNLPENQHMMHLGNLENKEKVLEGKYSEGNRTANIISKNGESNRSSRRRKSGNESSQVLITSKNSYNNNPIVTSTKGPGLNTGITCDPCDKSNIKTDVKSNKKTKNQSICTLDKSIRELNKINTIHNQSNFIEQSILASSISLEISKSHNSSLTIGNVQTVDNQIERCKGKTDDYNNSSNSVQIINPLTDVNLGTSRTSKYGDNCKIQQYSQSFFTDPCDRALISSTNEYSCREKIFSAGEYAIEDDFLAHMESKYLNTEKSEKYIDFAEIGLSDIDHSFCIENEKRQLEDIKSDSSVQIITNRDKYRTEDTNKEDAFTSGAEYDKSVNVESNSSETDDLDKISTSKFNYENDRLHSGYEHADALKSNLEIFSYPPNTSLCYGSDKIRLPDNNQLSSSLVYDKSTSIRQNRNSLENDYGPCAKAKSKITLKEKLDPLKSTNLSKSSKSFIHSKNHRSGESNELILSNNLLLSLKSSLDTSVLGSTILNSFSELSIDNISIPSLIIEEKTKKKKTKQDYVPNYKSLGYYTLKAIYKFNGSNRHFINLKVSKYMDNDVKVNPSFKTLLKKGLIVLDSNKKYFLSEEGVKTSRILFESSKYATNASFNVSNVDTSWMPSQSKFKASETPEAVYAGEKGLHYTDNVDLDNIKSDLNDNLYNDCKQHNLNDLEAIARRQTPQNTTVGDLSLCATSRLRTNESYMIVNRRSSMSSADYNGEILLVVDSREKKSSRDRNFFQSFFTGKGIPNTTRYLSVGDFIWVKNEQLLKCIVERKQTTDLVSSIGDGRYKEQKKRLLSTGFNVFYLVENLKVDEQRRNYVDRILLEIRLSGVTLIETASIKESGMFLERLDRSIRQNQNMNVEVSQSISASHNKIEKKIDCNGNVDLIKCTAYDKQCSKYKKVTISEPLVIDDDKSYKNHKEIHKYETSFYKEHQVKQLAKPTLLRVNGNDLHKESEMSYGSFIEDLTKSKMRVNDFLLIALLSIKGMSKELALGLSQEYNTLSIFRKALLSETERQKIESFTSNKKEMSRKVFSELMSLLG